MQISGLSKTFTGTRALSDVHFDVRPGEIHALVGHNGSGKSTLIKVLSGFHRADPGAHFKLGGVEHDPASHAVGDVLISFVHQDLGLIPELSATENLALHAGYVCDRFGRVRWRQQAREAERLTARFNVGLDVSRPLAEATPVQRTVVAIAAALRNWGLPA